jgi:catechol 2,3-dioxygenase-like lactoylglutathione lyase family enzyme
MFDHVGLRSSNLARSVRFYDAALKPLGFVLGPKDESSAGFGPPDAPALWLTVGDAPGQAHIAFSSASRAAVDAFHKNGLVAGGRDNGAPGLRPDYSPTYYGAFLIDPDGNNVEAVCHAEQA